MRGILLSLILMSTTVYANSLQEYKEKEKQLEELIALNQQNLEKQQTCLAKAIYFEAAHFENSQVAVGNVIINRVQDDYYPNTVCGVIHQKTTGSNGKKVCQFSYLCENKKKIVTNSNKWESAQQTAVDLINAFVEGTRRDPTKGATHFHDGRVHPQWAKSREMIKTLKTKKLTFYKKRGE